MSKTLVVYLMSGPETPELAEAAVEGGADVVELGFPFSDPLADGPVVRRAAERALARGPRPASPTGWSSGRGRWGWRTKARRRSATTCRACEAFYRIDAGEESCEGGLLAARRRAGQLSSQPTPVARRTPRTWLPARPG